MATAPGAPISRRTLFAGVGAVAAGAALSACSYFSSGEAEPSTVTLNPGALDPINGLIATTRLHLIRLNAAIAADKADAARLTPLRDDRQAHLTALEKEDARVNPAVSGAPSSAAAPTTGAVILPDNPEEIISAVRGDAATAQVQFTDAISAASRYRAALYGSIAASLASHRAVLA